ncbi:MAG: mechanosensitive ion channel family protein [Desulfobulbaceae bacterium]|uniref:Mechanosensitive ion channel family protein n=1 Tax=Candidatus Desulfobia pelagia TaxID=2841692 RepID=A0A8J6ND56_9BACT|nr:mechanosensitive ion channel family protein [Candidatus Desulfobia pelagia]
MLGIAVKVVIIIGVAIALNILQKKMIPRVIITCIPKVQEESREHIAIRTKAMAYVFIKIIAILIWTIGFVMVLGVLKVDTSALLATLGIASLGIGFAIQNIIRDYIQGFFIVIEDWYRIGDWITIAGMEGEVEDISPRRTVLREINGTMHVIPNSQIPFASNQTRDWARINLYVTVAYKEDISHVYQILNSVCDELKDDPDFGTNLTSTPSAMRVSDLGDHGVDICIRGYTKPGEQWGLTGELRKRIKNRFDQEGIEIPWPHTKVYFGNMPEIDPAERGIVSTTS